MKDPSPSAQRNFYAFEIEPRYVQVAIQRWQRFTGREAVKLDG
jgi:DNA modification methylase